MSSAPYQVLARKYRPQNFDDLIGHAAMVRTLRNAFATGRIAHAYVLTGVRGVGKTTTARILARALNYVGPNGEDNGPTVDLAAEGRHCRAIAESRHPDVFEMDAASRTGVGDIRELIEGVRYAPVEARYKVYIIDEVHMLSTAAFNALLKTLEEPPPHVKFIFATTEIRKLPVTVLSRCQRFDLRRIDPDTLIAHLEGIAAKENVAVEPDGLAMIARAAEGSVRDALSILDQALIQRISAGDAVTAEAVRDMLGLADRTRAWDLLSAALAGKAKEALEIFREQYDAGAELQEMVNQLYLSSMPDLSWTKHGIHRKGTPGFSQDARRAYAQNAFHGARYLAKLRFSDLLTSELTAMQKHIEAKAGVESFDSVKAQQVVDEMVKRHDSMMNPNTHPLATALTSAGFVFHLGLSPASATRTMSTRYPSAHSSGPQASRCRLCFVPHH